MPDKVILLGDFRLISLQLDLSYLEDFVDLALRLLSDEVNRRLLPHTGAQICLAFVIFNALDGVTVEHLDILFYLMVRSARHLRLKVVH